MVPSSALVPTIKEMSCCLPLANRFSEESGMNQSSIATLGWNPSFFAIRSSAETPRNVASMSSFVAVPFVPGYGAAKAGVVQMTKNLGVAWAREGVRVNAVAPGLIETNMTAAMKGVEQLEGPELARTPMGRWGTPEDVAPAFLFLASPEARFITGQTLCVDGGYSVN